MSWLSVDDPWQSGLSIARRERRHDAKNPGVAREKLIPDYETVYGDRVDAMY